MSGDTDPLTSTTPCRAVVTPADNGGIDVEVLVPTYGGGARFSITVERDNGGDWRVFIPWSDSISAALGHLPIRLDDGHEVANGILYLGAPDVPVESTL